MDGSIRRQKIIELLETEQEPISGTALAKLFGVSRQVVVQDIALLRVTNKNILSTNKGYIIYGHQTREKCKRIIAVKHSDEQMRDELYTIVDCGARVLDVIVEHEVYGQIAVDLIISSRKDVDEFMNRLITNRAKPLKELTRDEHYHTLEANEEAILNEVEKLLREKNYLLDISS